MAFLTEKVYMPNGLIAACVYAPRHDEMTERLEFIAGLERTPELQAYIDDCGATDHFAKYRKAIVAKSRYRPEVEPVTAEGDALAKLLHLLHVEYPARNLAHDAVLERHPCTVDVTIYEVRRHEQRGFGMALGKITVHL